MAEGKTTQLAPRTPAQWAKYIDRQACHVTSGRDFMNGWLADREKLIEIVKEIQRQERLT